MRRVRGAWRSLTGGPNVADAMRPTLVAVSGGADSAALAVALATLDTGRVVLGLVMHDLRPAELVHDDRRRLDSLARRLGVRLITEHCRVGEGNAEHAARRARYAALETMAAEAGCSFIATGHHAHDQLETLLLAMCRGASPAAMRGILRVRESQTPGIRVIRPALAETPDSAAAVCRAYGYEPRTDATNRDPARARAWLRRRVVPMLAGRFPSLGECLDSTTAQLAGVLSGLPAEDLAEIGLEGIDA